MDFSQLRNRLIHRLSCWPQWPPGGSPTCRGRACIWYTGHFVDYTSCDTQAGASPPCILFPFFSFPLCFFRFYPSFTKAVFFGCTYIICTMDMSPVSFLCNYYGMVYHISLVPFVCVNWYCDARALFRFSSAESRNAFLKPVCAHGWRFQKKSSWKCENIIITVIIIPHICCVSRPMHQKPLPQHWNTPLPYRITYRNRGIF